MVHKVPIVSYYWKKYLLCICVYLEVSQFRSHLFPFLLITFLINVDPSTFIITKGNFFTDGGMMVGFEPRSLEQRLTPLLSRPPFYFPFVCRSPQTKIHLSFSKYFLTMYKSDFFLWVCHLRLSQMNDDSVVGGLNHFIVLTLYQNQNQH